MSSESPEKVIDDPIWIFDPNHLDKHSEEFKKYDSYWRDRFSKQNLYTDFKEFARQVFIENFNIMYSTQNMTPYTPIAWSFIEWLHAKRGYSEYYDKDDEKIKEQDYKRGFSYESSCECNQ